MKKLILLVFIFCTLFTLKVFAQQIDVSTYPYFQDLYGSPNAKTIVLDNNIVFGDNLGTMGGNMYIKGDGNALVGTNSGAKYSGFTVSSGKTLTLDNVEIRGTSLAIQVSNAIVNILNGILFKNNGNGYSAILAHTNSKIIFRNGNIKFIENSGSNGGAIFNNASQIDFEMSYGDSIEFSSNTAILFSGGAIYNINDSIITFKNGNIIFSRNSVLDYNGMGINLYHGGGAIYNYNSEITFTGSTITFISNTGPNNLYGGAIYNHNAEMTFTNGNITFSGNTAGSGGAIYNTESKMTFANGNITFSGNTGGAIHNNSSEMTFTGNTIVFSGNTAYSGGAIYNFNSNANHSTTMTFTNCNVTFSGNTANSGGGGAIYSTLNSIVTFIGSTVTFSGNTANSSGGALYIQRSTVTFDTNGGEVLFKGNKANGKPNDVYMAIGAQLNINGSNTIRFEGGILSDISGAGIEINKSGTGAMYLGGTNEIWGDFNITGGDIILLADATYEGKALELPAGSALDMHNEAVNTVNVTGHFESKNNLQMDIFEAGNDEIRAASAKIGGSLDIFAGVGTYDNKEFELIITSNSLTGTFSSSSINYDSLTYELKYEDGIVKLIVDGMNVTEFRALSPLSLTYNQSETSKTLDKISANAGAWKTILTQMKEKQKSGSDAEIAQVKDFLTQTSGYFLSNVIRNMAADSPNNEVYDKIRNHAQEYKTNDGLWMQLKGGVERFKSDENSPENYSDVSMGVMFGFDRFVAGQFASGDAMWGVYARINKDNIEQGKHKATGNKNGLGVYGGLIKDDWEFKTMLLGSYDKFSTERMTYGGDIAKSDINGVTVSADIEAAFKIVLTENTNLKPYAGIEAANSMYGSFKERGAGIYNLDVDGGSYFRSAARVGAGIDYEKEIWIWYANIEGKYKIEGTKTEIESRFENTDITFSSRGSEEGKIEIGIGAGAEAAISQNWKIFINGKYYAGERYENLYGNTGVRYMFANRKSDSIEDARKKFIEAKKLYSKGEYLRATGMLSEITASYPDYKPSVSLSVKIQNNMSKTAESPEELDFSKLTYSKGYCSYYKGEYIDALAEWTKYVHFTGGSNEISEYMDKINAMLKLKDSINREAELDAKSNEMLNAGIEKYKASKWVLCIRDMEVLQKFVTENKFSKTDEYYDKAKKYIDMSVNELSKTLKTEKKEPKEPEIKAESKLEIDEIAADQKYNEGLMLYAQGKYLEAERTWEFTLRLNPNHQKAKIALSKLRSSGQLGE